MRYFNLIFQTLPMMYLLCATAYADTQEHSRQAEADQTIQQLYHSLNSKPISNFSQRIAFISEQFLGKPYETGPLGESNLDNYDQLPLYRTDAFDCVTFIETVLALTVSTNLAEFKHNINQIRYKNGQVSFLERNHFPDIDWNYNNQEQGLLEDITRTFKDKQDQPVFQLAQAYIDKPAWYQHFSLEKIRLQKPDAMTQEKQLQKLKRLGSQLKGQVSILPYIPLSALFDKDGQANLFLFNQIPQAAIIEIVRPNWDVTEKVGTHMNVSHLGLAIWKDHTLFFRASSSVYNRVSDIPLIEYLQNTLKSPTIKGINVQIVLPKSHHGATLVFKSQN
jgi:hypothetical protein